MPYLPVPAAPQKKIFGLATVARHGICVGSTPVGREEQEHLLHAVFGEARENGSNSPETLKLPLSSSTERFLLLLIHVFFDLVRQKQNTITRSFHGNGKALEDRF